ncbi:MAG: AbrB/MazE/SpoVT family DNA-binding domain-containing protein, partial [Nitrospinae bacterium]|nr:AbrB/MazE/SpoVT family DNA-binding domain-containing protein [Nitrospinota bacterium]
MRTTVQKWGNSLAVRIPSAYAKEVNLKNRDSVNISMEEGAIV